MKLTVAANRRVSFAPEATLHTWNVVEMPEDSTTSSASGNSTRRASGLTAMTASPRAHPTSPLPNSDASEPPSTPPAQLEESQVKASPAPAHQRDLHQKKRRRSSGIPPMNFNDPQEFSSSPCSGGSVSDDMTAEAMDSSDSDDKDLVEDESTVTGVDNDEITAQSNVSGRSNGSSTNSSGRLDEALRQAAKQAGTQGIEYDENGDITMEMADEEVTNAFQPWMKNGKHASQVVGNPSALQDQENINPFSPDFGSHIHANGETNEGDETMDFTQAAGSILQSSVKTQGSPQKQRRRSSVVGRRQSASSRRRSSGASSIYEDETMNLTTAIGGIQNPGPEVKPQQSPSHQPEVSEDENEELSMDLTTILGGVLGNAESRRQSAIQQDRRESLNSPANDSEMDMTFAAGGILSSITERTEPSEDQTVEMDVTQAVGAILPQQLQSDDKRRAKVLMEQETDAGQLTLDPFYDGPPRAGRPASLDGDAVIFKPAPGKASKTSSPSKGIHAGRPTSHVSATPKHSATSVPGSRLATRSKASPPSKQLTPQVGPRPTTPGKTPPSKNIAMRNSSPKRLFEKPTNTAITSPRSTANGSIFSGSDIPGMAPPKIVLKPRRRRSSGLGADKEGLGSPRVSELLDRRGSINQSAQSFVSNIQAQAGVRFEDPRKMEREIEQERADEERRESGRGILQMEADPRNVEEPKDATMNLKEMIGSLTPQKKPRARKSLHVGAAKGLLGKRPAELDSDEEEDTTLERLNRRERSPVKKIKLPAPPSKNETTRRNLRSARASLVETLGNTKMNTPFTSASPTKDGTVTTPQGQTRFKDVKNANSEENPMDSFESKLGSEKPMAVEPVEAEDRIHLRDFLNMTSIRFMELTTTKRRLTVAPTSLQSTDEVLTSLDQTDPEAELEKSTVAAACAIPMLELYQHVSRRPTIVIMFCC